MQKKKCGVYSLIQTIAIDMDGTLLNKQQKVSAENKRAIEHAQKEGVEIVIVTGRSFQEARFALDEANIVCPVICVNGAAVFSESGVPAYSSTLDVKDVIFAAKTLDEKKIYFEIYTDKGVYSRNYEKSVNALIDIFITANPELDRQTATDHAMERLTLGHVISVENYDILYNNPELQYLKLLAFSNDDNKMNATAEFLTEENRFAVSSSGFDNLEITNKQAQKGITLRKYLESKGKSLEQAMAIGDNYNDISMFKAAGISVAMGNAPHEIQQQADFVTKRNDEDGVAHAILSVLEGREI
ncbi:hypothetical protein SAMN05443252_102179 [Bacillus sp. OV322]|uniref:Cof-type HAD-IIB family hydrolase n=1 Tax=Bacillus sp. OV322 TaxID=1882764 RepID=UPI0008E820B8|nr:Cof-type HAD-IIB family hydrolase [Bacillus sp. OV322]SFC20276.1 hypothetical protein SAMN05443252_102179 [Bacillus sp. OV322]